MNIETLEELGVQWPSGFANLSSFYRDDPAEAGDKALKYAIGLIPRGDLGRLIRSAELVLNALRHTPNFLYVDVEWPPPVIRAYRPLYPEMGAPGTFIDTDIELLEDYWLPGFPTVFRYHPGNSWNGIAQVSTFADWYVMCVMNRVLPVKMLHRDGPSYFIRLLPVGKTPLSLTRSLPFVKVAHDLGFTLLRTP